MSSYNIDSSSSMTTIDTPTTSTPVPVVPTVPNPDLKDVLVYPTLDPNDDAERVTNYNISITLAVFTGLLYLSLFVFKIYFWNSGSHTNILLNSLMLLLIIYSLIGSLYWMDNLNDGGNKLCLGQDTAGSTNFRNIYIATWVLAWVCIGFLLAAFTIPYGKLVNFFIVCVFFINFAIIASNFAVIYPNYGAQNPITGCWVTYTIPVLVLTFFSYFVLTLFWYIKKHPA